MEPPERLSILVQPQFWRDPSWCSRLGCTTNLVIASEEEESAYEALNSEPPFDLITKAVETALSRHDRAGTALSLLLTDDEEMAQLNLDFRGIDSSTDVLSFPGAPFPHAPLGDIAISLPYAQRQAEARGVLLVQEICYLAIHGTLHLLGFEDEEEVDRAAMVAEMNKVAVEAGLEPDEEWCSLLQAKTHHPIPTTQYPTPTEVSP